ncbi:MAG: hypothetical protein WBC20_00085 [Candidatus Aminicenantaceae bacterium]
MNFRIFLPLVYGIMESAYVNTSQTKNRISLHGPFPPSILGDWIHDATDSAGC